MEARASRAARHCRKLDLPLPLDPSRPYRRPIVSSMEQSCAQHMPVREARGPVHPRTALRTGSSQLRLAQACERCC